MGQQEDDESRKTSRKQEGGESSDAHTLLEVRDWEERVR
jgi:hypothetical protein